MTTKHPSLFAAVPLMMAVSPCVLAIESSQSLGAWRDYALRGMTPDFNWADKPAAESVEPTVLSVSISARTNPRLSFAVSDTQNIFGLSVSQSIAGDTPAFENGGLGAQRMTGFGTGLERTLIAPSITQSVGTGGAITGAVVLAYQQFATWGMGSSVIDAAQPSSIPAVYNETSTGTGVRLRYQQQLGNGYGVTAAVQSKINMNEFQNYRGVYSDPGDFDMPAFASAGFTWNVSNRNRIEVGASRVMYSEVSPFTSSALPTRFLSLLGDGTSPVFAWRDLTVYSVDWNWQATATDALALRYTTQQQPEATSSLLNRALADSFTDNNIALAYTHQFRDTGSLSFGASYAAAQNFLGNASYSNRDGQGDLVEVEAVWTVNF